MWKVTEGLVCSDSNGVEATMHDVGRTGGLGFEQLPREVCREPQHRPAERGAAFGWVRLQVPSMRAIFAPFLWFVIELKLICINFVSSSYIISLGIESNVILNGETMITDVWSVEGK